jgi:uncharacterized protein YcaQ
MVTPLKVSVDAARRLQIEKQGVGAPPKRATKKSIEGVVNRVGCLQIDTINVVERAHYFTLWTRLGQYKKEDLYRLAYEDRRIFEGWGHAMCYMPMDHYRYIIAANKERARSRVIHTGWFSRVDPDIVDAALERVKKEGPLGSSDFEGKKPSKGWWGWKPQKRALEALFSSGDLMVTRRDGFQRVYDLTENVLPGWVDTTEPTDEERNMFFASRTLGSLGATKPADIKSYYHNWCVKLALKTKEIQALLEGLVDEGKAARLSIEGHKQPYYCLAGDAPRLDELDRDWGYGGVRFVNYFDSLLWQADRLDALFGFERALEVYLKPEQRKYGYFTTPILYGDKLIGRLDPKLDRKEKTLIVRGLWYEDGFKPDEEYEDEFAKTLDDFAKFGGVDKIEWRCEKAPTSSS